MLIIVEGFSGERYGAPTAAQVVAKMRESAWGGYASDGNKGWMKQVAKRVWDWSKQTIRVDKAENFLRDLAKAGLIKKSTGPAAGEKED